MKSIASILLLVVIIPLHAQLPGDFKNFNPRFEIFALPGGASGNSVQAIVQDRQGFLWFGSQAGLHRYDGQKIITYLHDNENPNSLSSDYIEGIFLDSKGILWLTHWELGGLTSFDPETQVFTRYQNDPKDPESLSSKINSLVVEDKQGYIWVAGNSGLDRLDRNTGKFRNFHFKPGDSHSLSCDTVRGLYVDKQGTLWAGTGLPWDLSSKRGGLNRYDPKTESFTRYLHDNTDPHSISNDKVRALFEDSKGNFWVGSCDNSLNQMDRENGTFKSLPYDPVSTGKLSSPLNPTRHITSFSEDNEGRIWITAFPGGLTVYDPPSGLFRHFAAGQKTGDLTTNFLWQTFQTRDGTLWIDSGGGDGHTETVFKVRQQDDLFPFIETSPVPVSSGSLTFSHGILDDREGNVWIAYDVWSNQGAPCILRRYNRKTGLTQVVPFGDPKDPVQRISSLSLDLEGRIWIGTDHGQFRGAAGNNSFQLFQPPGAPANYFKDSFSPVLNTRSGEFWFGSMQMGLLRYEQKSGQFTSYRHNPKDPNSLDGDFVWAIHEDGNGGLWVGGGNPWGNLSNPIFLDRINPQTNKTEHFIKTHTHAGMVGDLVIDKKGIVWFTNWIEGFERLDPSTGDLRRFTTINSMLPSGNLFSMAMANDGKLWLSDPGSLIEFDPTSETMSVYNSSRGIRPARDYYGSGSITSSGELLFSRTGGFFSFHPENLLKEKNKRPPELRITGFQLLDERTAANGQFVLEKPIWQTSTLSLSHDQNVFAISIACFDFYNPAAIQLQFRLEGYDKTWRKDLNQGEIPPYINVPPGEYTFRVRGANSYGVWNLEGIKLSITVLPPWWRTIWAYSVYALLVMAGVYSVHRFQRAHVIKTEREKVQAKELVQAREIEKAYHELRNTQAQLIQSEKMASLGELTAGIAHEIQNPLNFVNNFSEVNSELISEMKEKLSVGHLDEVKAIANDIDDNEKKILFHGKRADAIVKGMLQHSRSSSHQKEPTDINALADEYLRLSYHGLRARDKSFNATMKTEFDPALGKISAIPQDMGRVILNLLTNAFYAVSEKKKLNLPGYEPTVTVVTRNAGPTVEIQVKDNGHGIPQKVKDKIFQPFFTTKPSGQGTGLGLSISYDIITQGHGGEMRVETLEGVGTTFIIQLPNNKS